MVSSVKSKVKTEAVLDVVIIFSSLSLSSSEGPSSVIDGISDSDLVAEATGRKKYIYGFKGNKYYFGKPWDVFSR